MKSLSRVRLVTTPRTAAYQAPLPMGFSRQEYWSGLPNACKRHEVSASWIPDHVLGDLKVKVKVAQSCPTLCDPMEQSMEFSLDYISPLRTQ